MPDFMGASLPFPGEQKESQTLSRVYRPVFQSTRSISAAAHRGGVSRFRSVPSAWFSSSPCSDGQRSDFQQKLTKGTKVLFCKVRFSDQPSQRGYGSAGTRRYPDFAVAAATASTADDHSARLPNGTGWQPVLPRICDRGDRLYTNAFPFRVNSRDSRESALI
jgi:hypothetical protein